MSIASKNKAKPVLVFVLGLLIATTTQAWHSHGHPRWHRHCHGHHSSWDRGPHVILNLPRITYYVPGRRMIEVCNSYGQCWLRRR
jgi:hypothetical protein